MDLRRKIVDAVGRGLAQTEVNEVARTFNVSRSSVNHYGKMDAEIGSVAPSKTPDSTPKLGGTV